MKAILLINLLVVSSCETPVDVIKCFLESDVIFKGIAELIGALQEKDITKIIGIVMQYYGPFMEEIKKCLGTSNEVSLQAAASEEEDYPKYIEKFFRLLGKSKVIYVYKHEGYYGIKHLCERTLGGSHKLCWENFP